MVACVVQHSKQVRGVFVQRRSMALTLHREQVTIASGVGRERRLTDGDRDPHETDERSVGSCSTCAVRCVLLRERAEAKRRGELELMRNELDDGGQTERDWGGHEASTGGPPVECLIQDKWRNASGQNGERCTSPLLLANS
jgi:hypothetical protein